MSCVYCHMELCTGDCQPAMSAAWVRGVASENREFELNISIDNAVDLLSRAADHLQSAFELLSDDSDLDDEARLEEAEFIEEIRTFIRARRVNKTK